MPIDQVTGSLILGGANLLGGFIGNKIQQKSNSKIFEKNLAYNKAYNLQQRKYQLEDREYYTGQADKDRAIAADLQKHGLAYRIQDAKNAGINPLAALGLPLSTSQPVSVGGSNRSSSPPPLKQNQDLQPMGANIGNSLKVGMTQQEQEMHDLNMRLQTAKIEGQEIANSQAIAQPKPLPNVIDTPNEIPKKGHNTSTAGVNSMQSIGIDNSGHITFPISQFATEAMENDKLLSIQFNKNRLKASAGRQIKSLWQFVSRKKNIDLQTYVTQMQEYVAKQLGINPRFIHYKAISDEFYVDKSGMQLINYNSK